MLREGMERISGSLRVGLNRADEARGEGAGWERSAPLFPVRSSRTLRAASFVPPATTFFCSFSGKPARTTAGVTAMAPDLTATISSSQPSRSVLMMDDTRSRRDLDHDDLRVGCTAGVLHWSSETCAGQG